MAPNRLRGNKVKFKTDSTDYECDHMEILLEPAEADDDELTFCDAASGGGAQWTAKIKSIQSTDVASWWSFHWKNAGQDVVIEFAPHGNDTPTVAQPHFSAVMNLGMRPPIGGEAGTKAWVYEREYKIDGDVELIDGSTTATEPPA